MNTYELNEELLEKIELSKSNEYKDESLITHLYVAKEDIERVYAELKSEWEKQPKSSDEAKRLVEEAKKLQKLYSYVNNTISLENKKPVKVEENAYVPAKFRDVKEVDKAKRNKMLKKAGLWVAGIATVIALIIHHPKKVNNDADLINKAPVVSTDNVNETSKATPSVNSNTNNSQTVVLTNNQINNTQNNENKVPAFNDATNQKQIEARAKWYYDNYFDKEFKDLSDVAKFTANKETLADCIPVLNGKEPLYSDFNYENIIEYNNKVVQQFCSFLSLDNKSKRCGFVPSQYLYLDGSYEKMCAAEADAILEPLVKCINNEDNEGVKKYATMYGELMASQYLNVDMNDNHFNVRGMADFSSQIHLWSIAYAEYTNKIMPYCIEHNLDVCIPLCINHTTGETVEVPLAKLMTILEHVPVANWDAVIARSGMSIKELEALGNNSVEDTMPVIFTRNAKNHYRGKVKTLSINK